MILVATTQLFLPAVWFAYVSHEYVLMCSVLMAYAGSTSFHSLGTEFDTLHHIDIMTSRTSFAINLVYSLQYVPISYLILLSNNLASAYLISRILYTSDNPLWLYAHIYFHTWTMLSSFLLVAQCKERKRLQKIE